MNLRSIIIMAAFVLMPIRLTAEDDNWQNLISNFDQQKQVVAGNWTSTTEGLQTDATTGARALLPYRPMNEYDFRISFTRNSGVHSVAMIFVSDSGQATFEIDGWGQHLAGIQMIDGQTMQDNATRVDRIVLENGRRYTMLIQVRKGSIRAYLDDRLLAELKTEGSTLAVPPVWRVPDAQSLGIGAYEAATTFHQVEVRPASDNLLLASSSSIRSPGNAKSQSSTVGDAKSDVAAAAMSPGATRRSGVARRSGVSEKRVLLVIANRDFYYREYHEPRVALENAGIVVEVAAARKQMCYPHENSGQQDSGEVMPDLTIADADASRYDAIMFSGGWGSSMYQFAFQGDYSNTVYNGDTQTKETVNRLLSDFVKQDKYIGALCHGVSVLAWSRIDGASLLRGRRAVGSPRQSPAGTYDGKRGQPLSRWNAEINGARLTPARSIGNPQTSADDVMVDGKLITGEDDNSSRLFGETLARLLQDSK